MKTTERFENAVTKLYKAFHEGTLDALNCKYCAVGNICNNESFWAIATNNFKENNLKTNSEYLDDVDEYLKKTGVGYSLIEIATIEKTFLVALGFVIPFNEIIWSIFHENAKDKEIQFKGLCAVIEYLAELDNIPNPMDYSKLFETENDKPKYELTF